jgi:hypothetical protein
MGKGPLTLVEFYCLLYLKRVVLVTCMYMHLIHEYTKKTAIIGRIILGMCIHLKRSTVIGCQKYRV